MQLRAEASTQQRRQRALQIGERIIEVLKHSCPIPSSTLTHFSTSNDTPSLPAKRVETKPMRTLELPIGKSVSFLSNPADRQDFTMKARRALSEGLRRNDLPGSAVSQYTDVLQVRINPEQS